MESSLLENGICPFCGKKLYSKKIKVLGKEMLFNIKCSCLKEKEKEKEKNSLFLKKMNKVRDCYNWSKLGRRLINCSFENYLINEDNKKFYNLCKTYVINFDAFSKKGIGLLVFGNAGNGKSHLTVSIFKEIMKRNKTAIFISSSALITRMNESKNYNSNEKLTSLINLLSHVELLVLDDLGAHKWDSSTLENLYKIIDSRYENLKPIIVSTNCSVDELKFNLGDRIFDRLAGSCTFVENKGKSYREKDIKDAFIDIVNSKDFIK